MRRNREICHVCDFIMETHNNEVPNFCGLCNANLYDRGKEVRVLHTTTSKDGGGINAEEVHVILTNQRIIFTGDEEYEGTAETLGWIFGGLIGGLIGSAVDEESSNNTRQVSVWFDDIASLEVQSSAKMFNKNARLFTICDKQGSTFFFEPGRNDADRLEIAIRNRLARTQHFN